MRSILMACTLTAASPAAVPAASSPPNFSSHAAPFFEEFLAGRVMVYRYSRHSDPHMRVSAKAIYFQPDGTYDGCSSSSYDRARANDRIVYRYQFRPAGKWKILHRGHALARFQGKSDPKPGHWGLYYDAGTGRLHMEGQAEAVFVGWVQETWPRVLANGCPDFRPPLRINEKQTAAEFEALKAQDPAALIRNFPASELRVPGAVGQGITDRQPTLSRAALSAFMRANHGKIVLNTRGKRRILVVREDKEELWTVDAEGGVTNIGHFSPAPDGSTIGVSWEQGKSPKWRYIVGYALPYAPTGERFGAFQLQDWMIAQEAVTLPFFGQRVPFRFSVAGKVETNKKGGSTVVGSWRWSRGSLELRFPGLRDVATYEWRALAREVGWSPTASAAAR